MKWTVQATAGALLGLGALATFAWGSTTTTDSSAACDQLPNVQLQSVPQYTNVAQIPLNAFVSDDNPIVAMAFSVSDGVNSPVYYDGGLGTVVASGGCTSWVLADAGVALADAGFPIIYTSYASPVNLTEGLNILGALVSDSVGGSGQAALEHIVLDTIPPVVTVVSPTPGQVVARSVYVHVRVEDATPSHVSLASPSSASGNVGADGGAVLLLATFQSGGAANIQVLAVDSAANSTTVNVPVTVDLSLDAGLSGPGTPTPLGPPTGQIGCSASGGTGLGALALFALLALSGLRSRARKIR